MFCVEPICFCKQPHLIIICSTAFPLHFPRIAVTICHRNVPRRVKGGGRIDASLVRAAAEMIISAVKGMIICVKL